MAVVNSIFSTASRTTATSVDDDNREEHKDKSKTWSSKTAEPHVQFFKTRLCPFREQGCRRGDNCTYAHNEQELRPSLNLTKTKLCYAHIRGKCQSAVDNCRYAHGHQNLRSTPQFYKSQVTKSDMNSDDQSQSFGISRSWSKGEVMEALMDITGRNRETISLEAILDMHDTKDATEPAGHGDIPIDLRHNSQQWMQPNCVRNNDVLVNALSSSTTRSMPGQIPSTNSNSAPTANTLRDGPCKFDGQDKGSMTPYLQDWNPVLPKPLENDLLYNTMPYDQNSDGLSALLAFLDSRGISIWGALYILKSLEQPPCRIDGNVVNDARPASNHRDTNPRMNW